MHLDDVNSERYLDAAYAYTVGRFDEAAAGFAQLVEARCAPAATYLGQMYLRGDGLPANVEKGLELLRLAASWGDGNAAYSLGALHRSGADNVPKDSDASRRYFVLARELGCELSVARFLQ